MSNQVVEAEVVAEAEIEAPVAGEVLQDGDDLTSGCEGVLSTIQKQGMSHSFAGVQSGSSVTAWDCL